MISAIIIDKDNSSRTEISKLLKNNNVLILRSFSSGNEALLEIDNLNPDVIFASLMANESKIFDLFSKLDSGLIRTKVIFAEDQSYALKAFDNGVSDYLIKPICSKRLKKTIARLNYLLEQQEPTKVNDYGISKFSKKNLPVKLGNKVSFISKETINYILASGHYVEIFTNEKKHLIRKSLTSVMTELDKHTFVRVHRSRIININYIKEILMSNFGEIDIRLTNNKTFRVSKSYKKSFRRIVGI